METRPTPALVIVAMTLVFSAPSAARLDAQLTGEVAAETRWFPQSPLFPDQRDVPVSPSFSIEPELALDWKDGRLQFVARPFARLDGHDDRRTHVDVRELSLTWLGDSWTASAGLGRVFWGVTEVNHLIDVVNQTDAVEDLDSEDKLGQPMVNLGVEGGWGALDLIWLPYFRERTFSDERGRLRGPFPIATDAVYESGAKRWHQDFAVRWSNVFGPVDLGLSYFRGTSREPTLAPTNPQANPRTPGFALQPYYALIDQAAIDVQWTADAALWKLEAMTRGGHGDRFLALAAGVEYTLYQVFESSADVGLLAEVMIDGRDATAPPTLFDNDVFGGFRWALNDTHDTSLLGGVVADYEDGGVFALIEAERRVGSDWKMELEARVLGNTDPGSFTSGLRRDSFLTLRVSRYW